MRGRERRNKRDYKIYIVFARFSSFIFCSNEIVIAAENPATDTIAIEQRSAAVYFSRASSVPFLCALDNIDSAAEISSSRMTWFVDFHIFRSNANQKKANLTNVNQTLPAPERRESGAPNRIAKATDSGNGKWNDTSLQCSDYFPFEWKVVFFPSVHYCGMKWMLRMRLHLFITEYTIHIIRSDEETPESEIRCRMKPWLRLAEESHRPNSRFASQKTCNTFGGVSIDAHQGTSLCLAAETISYLNV